MPHDPAAPIDPDLTREPPRAAIVAAIAAGGALGAPARYGLAQLVHVAKVGFPWATFWTNVTGSFALGVVMILLFERFPPTRYVRPFVATGFIGAYTTFSTFVVEGDLLVKDGHATTAIVYVVASMVCGLAATALGIALGRAAPVRP